MQLGLHRHRIRAHAGSICILLAVQDAADVSSRSAVFAEHLVCTQARPTPRLLVGVRAEREWIIGADLHLDVGSPWSNEIRCIDLLDVLS